MVGTAEGTVVVGAVVVDAEVVGAPFYLMEYVPGAVLRTRQDTAGLPQTQARELSEGLADMLAAIHGVDVDAVGLADLGRGTGYLRRQLDRWQRQWELSMTREVPGYPELVARLTSRLPAEGETTLVHGDFRLDNVLVTVSPQPRITAVVDWEMATLGDPLAALGLTLVYWTDPGEEGWLTPEQKSAGGPLAAGVSTDATASPGFLSRAEFAAGYARRTGRDISRIGTTWRSATSSSQSSSKASTPATCSASRSAKASPKTAWPSPRWSPARTRCSTQTRPADACRAGAAAANVRPLPAAASP